MKRRTFFLIVLMIVNGSWTLCASADDQPTDQQVPVVGLDDHQNPILKMIPLSSYLDTLQSGVSAVQDSLMVTLQKDQNSTAAPLPKWKLQTVGVGLSFSGQIGIGPIWSITATPRFRLIFTNSKNPIYPVYN